MTTPGSLQRMALEIERHSSDSEGSLNDSLSKSSRNELSEILDKIDLSKSASPSTPSTPSSDTNYDKDVDTYQVLLDNIAKESHKASLNIMMHVKYLSSPLRLYLKTKLAFMTGEEKLRHLAAIKISDRVKMDLNSEWNAKDSFGLKILMKMSRIFTNVLPMINSHDDFMRYFKPEHLTLAAPESGFIKYTNFYLFNHVMNPGIAYQPGGQPVELPHEMHSWFDGFAGSLRSDIEAAGLSFIDIQKELVIALSFQLNVYASSVFKKPMSFKHFTGHGASTSKVAFSGQQLMEELFGMLNSSPVSKILADQMVFWNTVDEELTGHRVVRGGRGAKKHPRK